jgi:AraC-like DNA-binding protein
MMSALVDKNLVTTKAKPMLRLGHVMSFTSFLNELGVPFETHLQRNLLPVLCHDPDCYVPVARAWSFFDSVSRLEDPLLAWLVGRHVGDHNLNRGLVQRCEAEPSLYRALQTFLAMTRAEATSLQLGMLERQSDILLFMRYPGKSGETGYHQAQAYQIGVVLGLVRHFLGALWTPSEIGIEQREVPAGLEEMFPGCRIFPSQSAGYIAIQQSCLYRTAPNRLPGNDASGIRAIAGLDDTSIVAVLNELLKSYLPDGYPSAALASELLGLSERTLARKLAALGLSYGAVVDDVRLATAKALLAVPGVKIKDVALSVGCEDQSNFGRMFRRLTGLSPKQYRALFEQ